MIGCGCGRRTVPRCASERCPRCSTIGVLVAIRIEGDTCAGFRSWRYDDGILVLSARLAHEHGARVVAAIEQLRSNVEAEPAPDGPAMIAGAEAADATTLHSRVVARRRRWWRWPTRSAPTGLPHQPRPERPRRFPVPARRRPRCRPRTAAADPVTCAEIALQLTGSWRTRMDWSPITATAPTARSSRIWSMLASKSVAMSLARRARERCNRMTEGSVAR